MRSGACRFAALAAVGMVMAIAAATPAAAQDSMRCGSRLVSVGDAKDKVLALCGEPSSRSFEGVVRRAPSYSVGGTLERRTYYGPGWIEQPVEIWTYNFGSHKLVRRLRFVGDLLEQLETSGHGY